MTIKKELLAPAGDIEAGYAAIYYGADAVYLGLKQFSARATASNFDAQELNEFTGYAHSLGRKVFVTVNTVLQEAELDDLIKNLDVCRAAKVDALIVQDLGVAGIVKQYYPELSLHASTQMAVHNKEGASALKKLGFTRVVLARELTIAEIKEIATIKDLELECFIHGALCYCYSGICQFSSFESGRSANRGKCLYPCRAEFVKDGKKGHYFSMKDMALEEDILKLPVYSLKIEGRKKNALYVAAVVDYYRKILDGKTHLIKQAENIKQIFARPWCKFHFNGKTKNVVDRDYVGHRGLKIGEIEEINGRHMIITPNKKIARHDGVQIEIKGEEKPWGFSLQNLKKDGKNVFEAQKGERVEIILPKVNPALKKGMAVYLASSSEVKGAYDYKKPKPKEFWQKPTVEVKVKVVKHLIKAQANGEAFELKGDFDEAKNATKTEAAIRSAFTKTGEVDFDLGNLIIENEDNLFVPVSLLNELRRGLYAKVKLKSEKIAIKQEKAQRAKQELRWIIQVDRADKCAKLDLQQIDEIIYLVNENTDIADIKRLPKNKVRIALPVICRRVNEIKPLIEKLSDDGYKKWEVNNYWGLEVLPKGIDLSCGNMIYMLNTQAINAAKNMGVSRITLALEDNLINMSALAEKSILPVVLTIYQNVPLFVSAVCVRENDCAMCDKKLLWSSLEKDGKKYLVKSENCQTEVYAESAFSIADVLSELKPDYAKADFSYMDFTAEEIAEIWQKLKQGENPQNTNNGNLRRQVL